MLRLEASFIRNTLEVQYYSLGMDVHKSMFESPYDRLKKNLILCSRFDVIGSQQDILKFNEKWCDSLE